MSPVAQTISAPLPRGDADQVDLSVIVPMYREALRVGPTLDDIIQTLSRGLPGPDQRPLAAEVILVDDGSPDDTIPVVTPRLTEQPSGHLLHIRLVRHPHNRGKGAAVRTGLAAAAGDWRLIMDADNACRVDQAACLLGRAAPGVGLVAGSRVAPGAQVQARPFRKLSGLLFKLALLPLGLNLLKDTQCGFKLYRADLARIIAEQASENGYAFDLEHLLFTRAAGLTAEEVGVRWTHMDGGQVRPVRDGLKMLREGVRLRRGWSARARQIPRLPASLPMQRPRPSPAARPEIVVRPHATHPAAARSGT